MNRDFKLTVTCALCGGVVLAHLHDCKAPACRDEPHVHEEIPVGGNPSPQVMGTQRIVATASSAVLGSVHWTYTLR